MKFEIVTTFFSVTVNTKGSGGWNNTILRLAYTLVGWLLSAVKIFLTNWTLPWYFSLLSSILKLTRNFVDSLCFVFESRVFVSSLLHGLVAQEIARQKRVERCVQRWRRGSQITIQVRSRPDWIGTRRPWARTRTTGTRSPIISGVGTSLWGVASYTTSVAASAVRTGARSRAPDAPPTRGNSLLLLLLILLLLLLLLLLGGHAKLLQPALHIRFVG